MISFKKYGFRCASEFRRARGLPESKFDEIMQDSAWKVRRHVLLHPDCPVRIRDQVRATCVWYQRIVAIMAKHAPVGYWQHAKNDPDIRVRRTYSNRIYCHSHMLRHMLLQLEVITEEQAQL